ncbi:clasp N terminal-domain-containing protein [Aspergillus granulosus]|uniref:Clasp N terminal-domain-containing protein n=1 Tax=Aspergillus granulosus TaxID=176169 RepID=A0ABR4HE08_9EURO
MESKAVDLVAVLTNNNLSIDTKVTHILGLKSDIKQKNVPEGAVPPIFESLRLSIASPHYALLAAGFSTLGHCLKRLFIQGQHDLVSMHARVLYPHLIERLGDSKERVRAQAAQAFSELWSASNADVEDCVLGVALKSKSPRSKQAALIWLESMHNTHVILFRNYVHDIVACLENADSSVRDQAKRTILSLFENAPANAKADLVVQMTSLNVRKSIADPILKALGLESEIQARPPSRGDALYNRPPSRGDALHNRPPSRGDALHHRPPSRGDALHNRPPSRGDALHNRPPSRGDALHNRPPSRGDVLHNRPPSRGDALHNRPPSRGDALRQQKSANNVSANNMSAQEDTEYQRETPPLLVKPIPIRPHQSPARGSQTRAPRETGASVDRSSAQSTPKPIFQQLDDDEASGDSFSQQGLEDSTSKDGYQEPTKRQLDKCEVAPYKITPREVASTRDLDSILREIAPPFQGRETEDNWMHRFHGLLTLRRVTVGNAPHDFPQAFVAAIKAWLDNIFKVVLSLRTSMITMGCFMVEDLARVLGHRLDPMIDIFMQNLMKLCMSMKKLVGSIGNNTVEVMIKNLTRNSRLLSHVTTAAQEKNVNLRLYGASWIKIIITHQTEHKISAEGMNGIETCIRKSLVDANPGVREAMRSTFWAFYGVWPKRANRIISDLDAKSRTLLEKDPSNPNNDPFTSNLSSSKTGFSSSISTNSGRSAPKAPVAEGKKTSLAAPTKGFNSSPRAQHIALPDAMSADRHRKPPPTTATSRAVPRGTNASSLTSAPMRPGGASKQRPAQLDVARPATATDFHSNPPESPARIPIAHTSPLTRPLGATRPRQNSDPLQDASPTKIRAPRFDVDANSADQPFGTLHIPKARANSNEQKQIEETLPQPRVPSIDVSTRSVSDEKETTYDEEKPAENSMEYAAHQINDEKEVKPDPRRISIEVVAPPIDDEPDLHDEQFVPRREVSLEPGSDMRALEKDEGNISPQVPTITVEARRVSSNRILPESPKIDHRASGVYETPKVNNDKEDDSLDPRVEDRPASGADDMSMQDVGRALNTVIPSRRKASNRLMRAETSKRRNISPRSQDIVQARQMLAKGIERIRAREMDITGYRKLQGLIEFHDVLFVDEKQFDFTLLALIDELQSPIPSKDAQMEFGTTWDLKLQVIVTLRYMFDYANQYFLVHYPFTVVALLRALRDFEIAPTVVEGLEHLLHDIIAVCEPASTIDAVVDALETEDKDRDVAFKSLKKGLEVLGHILTRVNAARTLNNPPDWSVLSDATLEHVGALAGYALGLEEVRRETVTMCGQLHKYLNDDERLWRLLRSPSQAARSLITYYIMRRH